MFMRAREMQQANGGNDPQGAVALYKKVAVALPNSMEAHLRLSEALAEAEDIDGALSEARKATSLAPKSAEATTHLAVLEYAVAKRQGKKANAAESAEPAKLALLRATRLSPNDPDLWLRLADICESALDAPGALNAWLRLGNIRPYFHMGDKPVHIVAFERAVYLAHQLKRYGERRDACLALLREPKPTEQHLKILEELAREQTELGYLGHAEESFALLAKQLPHESTVWQNMALVQRHAERFEDAAASLEKAQGIKPEPQNVIQQAYCLMNMGGLAQARDLLLGLLSQPGFSKRDNSAQQVQSLLSACLLVLDRPNDLLGLIEGWENVTESGILSSHRALALIRAGNMSAAGAAMEDGARRFPEHLLFKRAPSIPLGMNKGAPYNAESAKAIRRAGLEASAYIFAEFRQWEKCLGAIDEIHGLSPIGDVELLLLKSNALESLGRRDEALNVLRECHLLEPSHPAVQNNLGYHLLELDGDVLEASRLISAALSQEPDNASYIDSWGWALFKQGEFGKAEAVLRKAVEANPLSPEIRKHLGETLLKLDRPQEALEQWERALAFASRDRKGLEGQVRKLKTELAKKALEENTLGGYPPESDSDSDDDGDDDGWLP
jgi:tetratricopeptide (TPR) repeat protein